MACSTSFRLPVGVGQNDDVVLGTHIGLDALSCGGASCEDVLPRLTRTDTTNMQAVTKMQVFGLCFLGFYFFVL